jgi:Family of unknown function (DUF6515)
MKSNPVIRSNRPLRAAILAMALGAAGAWVMPAAQADEHPDHGRQERNYHAHEYHERDFHDKRYMDTRYHHDHYYPPAGFVFGALPRGYATIGYRGAHYYFAGGVWYRGYGPGRYVVVAPPVGIVVPVLPAFHTALWIGGLPYYYANNVYYVQAPQGYVVAAPPPANMVVEQPPASAVPPGYVEKPAEPPPPNVAATTSAQVFAYPQRQQSSAQQATDRSECQRWAVSQTGFDPSQPPPGGATATQTDDFRRAIAACLEARGYSVK